MFRVTSRPLSPVDASHVLMVCGHPLRHEQPINGHILRKRVTLLSQQPSTALHSSDGHGASGDPCPTHAEVLPGLH